MDDFTATVLRAVLRRKPGHLFTTSDVAEVVGRQPGRDSNRKHSAAVSEVMHTLEVYGHVQRAVSGMGPILWVRPALTQPTDGSAVRGHEGSAGLVHAADSLAGH